MIKVPGTKLVKDADATPRPLSQEPGQYGHIMLFSGSASKVLTAGIAKYLELEPGHAERLVFPNENIFIQLKESVRGQDVFLIQTMSHPLHDNFMEMLIMIDALKRDSAGRINVVIPYMSYTRSDKKDQPRVPITARLVANMIETAGADRYITVDLHTGQIQGFFNIPGDNLTAFHLLSDHVLELKIPDLTVVSADLGFAKKARNFAEKLGAPLAIVEKRRLFNTGQSEALTVIGDVQGRNVLIVDDEVLTGGTIADVIESLREKGARDVYLAFSHALLAPQAVERFKMLDIKQIITTDTVSLPPERILPNMKILSVAPMLGEVILRTHQGRSVGELFNE